MGIYTSQGNIRMCCRGKNVSLTFVPSNDYSIKRGDDHFAVFVEPTVDPPPVTAIVRKYTEADGVNIEASARAGFITAICSAAMHSVKVQVEVEEFDPPDSSKLMLTTITVPAK